MRRLRAPSGRVIRPGDVGLTPENILTEIVLVEGLPGVSAEHPRELEAYQVAFMACQRRFRCAEKARQLGFSWIFAAEALSRCLLRSAHTSIFVSYNLDDAKEKIRYARQLYDEIPAEFRKPLVEDAKTHLAFDGPGGPSRILSLPSKAPRGKGGDIYLDEFAHYLDDSKVYLGSTALIARHPMAQLTIASTPQGRRGKFWEIAREETEKLYPYYYRFRVGWWLSKAYCIDPAAAMDAGVDQMPTAERVQRWGTQAIKEQFDSLLLEDFQQEFECAYVDEAHSYYPWSLINSISKDIALREDFHDWEVKGRLYAGYDVGRKRDVSALVILEEIEEHLYVRFIGMWQRKPFDEQEAILSGLMESLPIQRLRIDSTGIGMQLAETMVQRYTAARVEPCHFLQQNKELWAGDAKMLMEKRQITLPRHRDLLVQTHAIRRTVSPSGHSTFDSERNARHHGDLYWALALAAFRDRSGVVATKSPRVEAFVIG